MVQCLGFRVYGLWLGGYGLWFGVLGFEFWVLGFGFRVEDVGLRVERLKVYCLELRNEGLGFRGGNLGLVHGAGVGLLVVGLLDGDCAYCHHRHLGEQLLGRGKAGEW